MSLCCTVFAASYEQISRLLEQSKDYHTFREAFDAFQENAEDYAALDKNWHAIHFLLTGQADGGPEPLCYLICGGTDISQGDGSRRVLTPDQTRHFADALSNISSEELMARMDPSRMTALDIYPAIWEDEGDDPDTLEWIQTSVEELQGVVQGAAKRRQGLVINLG